MENKQTVKKLIARIAAGVMLAAFLVGFAAPAAFALDTTGGLTDDNASGGTNSGFLVHFFEIGLSCHQTVGLKRL